MDKRITGETDCLWYLTRQAGGGFWYYKGISQQDRNPIFTKDGDNVKVKVAVKFLDNQTKAMQVSQYELVLHKDSNWKIVG